MGRLCLDVDVASLSSLPHLLRLAAPPVCVAVAVAAEAVVGGADGAFALAGPSRGEQAYISGLAISSRPAKPYIHVVYVYIHEK